MNTQKKNMNKEQAKEEHFFFEKIFVKTRLHKKENQKQELTFKNNSAETLMTQAMVHCGLGTQHQKFFFFTLKIQNYMKLPFSTKTTIS